MEGREAKIIPFPERNVSKKKTEIIHPYGSPFDPEIGLDALRADDDANRVRSGEIRPDQAFSFLEKGSDASESIPTNSHLFKELGKKGYEEYTQPTSSSEEPKKEKKEGIA